MSDVVWADEIAARLHVVEHRIAEICRQVGRPRASVRLVAVSKRKPAAAIRAAYALGLRDFGENYAQELRDKSVELADLPDLRWRRPDRQEPLPDLPGRRTCREGTPAFGQYPCRGRNRNPHTSCRRRRGGHARRPAGRSLYFCLGQTP